MADLSVLIAARQEMFLKRTVEEVLAQRRGDTNVIVVLDGAWANPPLDNHKDLLVAHEPVSIGQRAAINLAAKLSTSRYVMKLDAHCALDEGFDVKLIAAAQELGPDVTQIPAMYNLHGFNWKCLGCGVETYQGPTPTMCAACALKGTPGGPFERVIYWDLMAGGVPGGHRRSEFWRFDHDLHFQYHHSYKDRPAAAGDIADVMTAIGACFFMERRRYWELGGLDESHGSWGQFGVEIACKSWLSGGRHVVNKRTWFAHLFRTQGGDFGFPYHNPGNKQNAARDYSQRLWLENRWPGQVRPLSWLIERFSPLPDWSDPKHAARLAQVQAAGKAFEAARVPVPAPAAVTKGLAYYTDGRVDPVIGQAVRDQLQRAAPAGATFAAVALGRLAEWRQPLNGVAFAWSDERGYLTMFRQILACLEALETDVAFLVEHDVLYHPSHFEFTPPRPDVFYYNQNTWKVGAEDGRALHYLCSQTSGCCAYRQLLVEHYRKRVAYVEAHGFDRNLGFEPGTNRRSREIDPHQSATWMSAVPNIDIRHTRNLTKNRWSQDQFNDKKSCLGWTEGDGVPGWGRTSGRFAEFLHAVNEGL